MSNQNALTPEERRTLVRAPIRVGILAETVTASCASSGGAGKDGPFQYVRGKLGFIVGRRRGVERDNI